MSIKKLFSYCLAVLLSSSLSIRANNEASIPELLLSQVNQKDTSFKNLGVAVTPSTLKFNVKPGTTITREIKITNDTKNQNSFRIDFIDFEMGSNGKPVFLPPREGRFSLSKWITVSPTFVELQPGEAQKLNVTLQVPVSEAGNKAAWCIMAIDQVMEKQSLSPPETSDAMALGIIPSFGFGIYLYQNPPTVTTNKVEITNFEYFEEDQEKRFVRIEAKNIGDGIAFCASYVELTNLRTGKQERLGVKTFTILPEYIRDFKFELPAGLTPGKYSLVSVLDFGSKEEIEAAELEFEIN